MHPLKSIKLWIRRRLSPSKIQYCLTNEPIDVVIPCASKDIELLEACIEGVKMYGQNIRNIIVVSKTRFTTNALWFSEELFPFSKRTIAEAIFRGDQEKADSFINHPNSRIGWIFQQCLKFYAPFVIPGISSNVLILDADVIFLNPTRFMTEEGAPLFNVGTEKHRPYFAHAKRLLSYIYRVHPQYSGICHYMLFQKPILKSLFEEIQKKHHCLPWQALCRCIDLQDIYESALSEYEIYFNYALLRVTQARIYALKWINSGHIDKKKTYCDEGYHYMACQEWLRLNH